ncbi:MAG: helix-hairpin-helix domain-containing protein [Chitinophagaceae bacterium]|nr:helix-hairpin-helix domain-containing protein [Chitinophagaceae bacterium]
MRIFFVWLILLLVAADIAAQVTEPITSNTEQQLENITENNEDIETEDDAYLQEMVQFIKNPIELNYADAAALNQLRMLTPMQVHNFILYRNLVGKLVNLYELQAVPGWDIGTIQKLRPYINVSIQVSAAGTVKRRLKNGEHSILLRASQVPERSKGYLLDSSIATNFYPGSPQKYLFRYKYAYRNLLQYGIVAEKDAGEQFFKGKQKQGFDFYSAHIFVRKVGIIKALAIGDFTVNLGQGLTQWQSLAFKKSAAVINIKREGEILRPYNSAGEINFHRGLGITLTKKNWQLTMFGSYRNIDANFVADTSQTQDDFISSLQTSGYHRTNSETADKGIQRQLAFGGNLSYQFKRLYLGINGIQYRFKFPLIKSAEPYNFYALSGNSFGNYSIDYSYTFKNLHLFGEAAFTSNFDKAFINGVLISASSKIDLSLVYRNISKSYQSLYSNGFTENTYPTNENGFYAGVSISPANAWRIDAYADFFKFPWLRYRVDAPSTGSDYLIQLSYKPNKQLEIYTRFHSESKAINVNPGQLTLSPVTRQPKKNWRTQVSYRINTAVTIRNRTEIVWFDKKGLAAEEGFLTYVDFLYKPMLKAFSGVIRLQYFETDGYNSRLYAYENDVLYSFSIPVFYDKGLKYYVNINYDINKKITLWIKWAQTIYNDKTLIGSGLDEIKGTTKSEVKLQVQYKF